MKIIISEDLRLLKNWTKLAKNIGNLDKFPKAFKNELFPQQTAGITSASIHYADDKESSIFQIHPALQAAGNSNLKLTADQFLLPEKPSSL
ncbi:MAG: hypothetical protein WBY47_02780 [Desulfobacterales bacterium]